MFTSTGNFPNIPQLSVEQLDANGEETFVLEDKDKETRDRVHFNDARVNAVVTQQHRNDDDKEEDISSTSSYLCLRNHAETFYYNLNINQCKHLSVILVVCFIIYHGLRNQAQPSCLCYMHNCHLDDLTSNGTYINESWVPTGHCYFHKYTATDVRECLLNHTSNQLVFIGDSRIRTLLETLATSLSVTIDETTTWSRKHAMGRRIVNSSFFPELTLNVTTVWSPLSKTMVPEFTSWIRSGAPPDLIVVGCGMWDIWQYGINGTSEALLQYSTHLKKMVVPINRLTAMGSKVIWTMQVPVVKKKVWTFEKHLMNNELNLFNKAAVIILRNSSAVLWHSHRIVAQANKERFPTDVIHYNTFNNDVQLQILFNIYCNNHTTINTTSTSPSCCPVPYSSLLQTTVLSILVTLSIFAVLVYLYQLKPEPTTPPYSALMAAARMAVIIGYFYLCDGTKYFPKEDKHFISLYFWMALAIIVVVGMIFNGRSRFDEVPVLHRDLTDEWKGWMQGVILICSMSDAGTILPIYMHIRLIVSCYVFLTGFGHFLYFYNDGEPSIRRFLQILFRLNFLTLMLCLCMNTNYQTYYFIPLVTFWFTIIYILLAIPPRLTAEQHSVKHVTFLLLKLALFFSIITVLFFFKSFFKSLFLFPIWKDVFTMNDNEWWSQWKVDRYGALYGLVFTTSYVFLKRYIIFYYITARGMMVVTALFMIAGYTTFSFHCTTKDECNDVHPYITLAPILGYIALRNIFLRNRFSTFFAWIGRISLELFICHYHIWLATDSKRVLVLLPGYPVVNLALTSLIFVCVAHEIREVTVVLQKLAIPQDKILLVRNVVIFMLLMIPIAVSSQLLELGSENAQLII